MEVTARPNEDFSSLLTRFKRKVQKDGIIITLCNRKFAKPSEKRRDKRNKALARFHKRERIRESLEDERRQ